MSVTIKDIARIANVSIATVSKVINNKDEGFSADTKNRIRKIMKEMDYHPNSMARGLVTKKTNILGLILPDITNPFFPDIVRGVEDTANLHGYNVILCNTDDDEKKEMKYFRFLKEKCVDGIIYTTAAVQRDKNIQVLSEYNIPFIMMDRYSSILDAPYVHSDNEKGMYEIVKYLISQGHQDIAFISGPPGGVTTEERKKGFIMAMEEAGVEIRSSIIEEGNYKIKGGISCMESLLDSGNKFTAVACANDLMAVGALEVLKNRNIKVPEEISITGYDDIYISNIASPKLTTIAQPKYDMGKICTELLIRLIKGEEIEQKETKLEPVLVIRESVMKRSDALENSSNR